MMKKIIIVGGGIAGISAGIFAQKNGFKSIILEKNNILGGECTGWYRHGNFIDGCIHWLTGTKNGNALNQLWKEVGALENVGIVKPELFFRYETLGKSLTLWRDIERFRKEMLSIAPEDRTEIENFINFIKCSMSIEMPIEKPMEMMNILDYTKLGKCMSKALKTIKITSNISCGEYARRFKNPFLKSFITSYIPSEFSLMSLIMSLSTFMSGNGDIPEGGSLEMIRRMEKKYYSLGGKVRTSCEVKEVIIENAEATGVLIHNGERISGDYVVLACDADVSYHKLLKGNYNNSNFENMYADKKTYPIQSCCLSSFAVDADLNSYAKQVIFDTEPYNVANKAYHQMSVMIYNYIKNESGKTTICSIVTQFGEDFEYWNRLYSENHQAYNAAKAELGQSLLKRIEIKYPELGGKITLLDVATPITYARYCGAFHGSYMAFMPTPGVKTKMHSGKIKNLRNCFLTGQWLQSPGGTPVAVVTGKFTIQRICKKEKRKFVK